MIRGPVLPQIRDSLWGLVASRLEQVESGLTLVLESLDCSDGELGAVEGLARDAVGGIVLVMLAADGDALLPARALSAGRFLGRVHQVLGRAVPEAKFCPGVPSRILLIGTESSVSAIEEVRALPIEGLQTCVLEPFRIAGQERFAVRWLPSYDGGGEAMPEHAVVDEVPDVEDAPDVRSSQPEFAVPSQRVGLWQTTLSICERIDDGIKVHGDRFSRIIAWNGDELGKVCIVGGNLIANAATGVIRELRDLRDVRCFGDQLLRAFVQCAELDLDRDSDSEPKEHTGQPTASVAGRDHATAPRHAVGGRGGVAINETLRSSLVESKLTPEEYSALGESASSVGSSIESSAATDRS